MYKSQFKENKKDELIASLSDEELAVYNSILHNGEYGLERTFMDTKEIKIANILVKKEIVYKGHADTKQGNVTYFLW